MCTCPRHAPERSTPLYALYLSLFQFIPKKIINFSSYLFFFFFWSGTQVLEENRRQGEEDQAFEKRVEGKKAAAKKRATRRSAYSLIYIYFTIYHWEKIKADFELDSSEKETG